MAVEFIANSPNPRSTFKKFNDRFWDLAHTADEITIAVGYVDTASLAELNDYVSSNSDVSLKILVGMQYFDGLTTPQLNALTSLQEQLVSSQRGEIFISTRVRYHGKIYLFDSGQSENLVYVGSGNLSSISKSYNSTFEAGVLLTDTGNKIETYLKNELLPLAQSFSDVEIEPRDQNLKSPLENQELASQTDESLPHELRDSLTPTFLFEIPLKATKKLSNINACFGAPRENKKTGRQLVRPWYEVELIPGKAITTRRGYPQNLARFDVITDNGYTFECTVQGQDGNKNLRSSGRLSVLGAYLKGHLEASGLLKPGEFVTPEMLDDYGRDTVSLMYFEETDRWIMDFRPEDSYA